MDTLFKALSHPWRRRIIGMPRQCPPTSGDIAAAFDAAWPTITGHMAVLREAGPVDQERDGTQIRYRLSNRRSGARGTGSLSIKLALVRSTPAKPGGAAYVLRST